MKKCMTNYLFTLSESDYEKLRDIICHKYHEFLKFYWLLKEYSEFIISLEYDDKSDIGELKISIKFSGVEPKDIANKISHDDSVNVKTTKSKLIIEIYGEDAV